MTHFKKVFSSMLDSTVWREPDSTRLLWLTMILMSDQDGIVSSSLPGLADRARITLEQCKAGIKCFMEPDEYSRTKDHEGRRIREVDGGWELLNHDKYKYLKSEDDIKEKARIRAARFRERHPDLPRNARVTMHNACVTQDNASNAPSREKRHIDVDIDVDKKSKATSSAKADMTTPKSLASRIPENFVPLPEHYELAKELGINCEMEFQRFRDYWLGASGAKARKCDWPATLRNWLRTAAERKGGNGYKSASERRNEENRARIERIFREDTPPNDLPTDVWEGPTGRRT